MIEANATATTTPVLAKKRKKKKVKKSVKRGQAHIMANYNNTIITITDQNGNVLAWSSAGACGFKGSKKSTPYAAGIVVKKAMEKISDTDMQEVDVFLKGVGSGREGAVRALHTNGLQVMSIKDMTPIPHNGCRPPKVRRV
jgi:small subunit ribosomal protein S11